MNDMRAIHPDRPELLSLAGELTGKSESEEIVAHILSCHQCQSLANLFRVFAVAGNKRLADVPDSLTSSAYEVCSAPQPDSSPGLFRRLQEQMGQLTFDSWVIASPATVRSLQSASVRHLRVEDGDIVIDVRAERSGENWNFVAELVSQRSDNSEFIAEVGSDRIEPDESGFYHWSVARPTNQIKFVSNELVIAFPLISWKQPLPN